MQMENIKGTLDTSTPLQSATINTLGMLQKMTNQNESYQMVTPDLSYFTILLVNVCFYGNPSKENEHFTLIDAGLPSSAPVIQAIAKEHFGEEIKPKAILLTHGHFDHVGAVTELLKIWDVPVYAHPLELPYLTGEKDYPTGNPSVDPGMMAKLSPLYPNKAIDLKDRIHPLPSDGSVPGMEGWRWIHTPGHTPGHVSFFRDKDRILIAGDALTNVRQESLIDVITEKEELHGPPSYFTFDWLAAWQSIQKLKNLKPSIAITGHGKIIEEAELDTQLQTLLTELETYAKPH